MVYVEIAFPLPVPQNYSYRIPEGTAPPSFGSRVEAPLGKRKLTGWVISRGETPPPGVPADKLRDIHRVVDQESLMDEELLGLAQWLTRYTGCSLGEALGAMLPGGRREKELPVLGLDEEISPDEAPQLSREQQEAAEAVIGGLNPQGDSPGPEGKGRFFYLHGITGSGKTEVFIRAAQDILDRGMGVIFLVPEISLTHQTLDTLRRRFSQPLAVLHSGLTPSQRLTEWRRIQRGEARLVVGARSAVFAPVRSLGLIIMDEEHEPSYKSGNTPRYHARQVAMKRAGLRKARLLMGSATPSMEAWYAMETGRLHRLVLSRRLSGGTLPRIEPVSLLGEPAFLSRRLVEEMRRVLEACKQVILFLNRRGFSSFFHCRSCGYVMQCRQCSVSLTYHKQENMMVCHYCGYRVRPVVSCPDCGSVDVGYSSFGTEQIEEEVRRIFPQARTARLDTDSVRKKGVLQKTLQQFRRGEVDILLGTQMVAKGLNFPGVRLVGIVLADTGLSLPDFRAAERTFSLLTQVAGRAGRFDQEGKVLVQTYKPEHPAVALAVQGRQQDFYQWELGNRKDQGFPPFTRLIRLVFRSRRADRAEQSAAEFADFLEDHLDAESELLGPSECALGIIGGNHRWHLLVSSGNFEAARRVVLGAHRAYKTPAGVYVELDVDPLALL